MLDRLPVATSERDYWLQNPPLQPKRAIGDYFEAEGVDAAPRFDNPEDAAAYTGGIVMRGEHPLEYAGPSDLLGSTRFQPGDYSAESLDFSPEDWLNFNAPHLTAEKLTLLSAAYGYSKDEVIRDVSFSLWGLVDGMNRFMFADPANAGRYFVGGIACEAQTLQLVRRFDAITSAGNVENFHQVAQKAEPWPTAYGTPEELIEFYERIRNLDRFDSLHSPIIEVQSDPKEHRQQGLQYHRGRDANMSNFNGEKVPKLALSADHVFGGTVPEGQDSECLVIYEDGAIDQDRDLLELEILARSGMPVVLLVENVDDHFKRGVENHAPRSLWTKPPITLILQTEARKVPEVLARSLKTRSIVAGIEAPVAELHIVSDGKEASIDLAQS